MPSFFMTNMSADRVKVLPNKATKEAVMEGYNNVRSQFIDFVKKYNESKKAGTISLNAVELEAMNKLHKLWKTATLEKTEEGGGDYFFDMKDLHKQLNGKFPKLPEDTVCTTWNNYIQLHSDWLQVILMSGATMLQLQY